MGIRLFFGHLALVTQIIIFTVVHELTGFIEGGNPMDQPTSAIFGIHFHSGLIPALVVAITTLIFWCFYDLKPTKVAEIQQKLKAMNL